MTTLGMAPRNEPIRNRRTGNLAGRTHNVKHSTPLGNPDNVGMSPWCAESLKVRGDDRKPQRSKRPRNRVLDRRNVVRWGATIR